MHSHLIRLTRTPLMLLAGLAGLATLALSPPPVLSQTDSKRAESDVQVLSTMLPGGTQQVVVVDSKAQSMAVYHVEPAQGRITLKSVRRLTWDLQMEQFNAIAPLPSELKLVQ